MGGLVAAAGLAGGTLLSVPATLALRQGALLALGRWPRLAAVAAPLALAAPAFAFATLSARMGLSGAALGAAAGGFTGIGLTAAVVAWGGARGKAKGATTLATGAALSAAAVMVTGFDSQIKMSEGRLMLLFAVAVLLACWRARLPIEAKPWPAPVRGPWIGLLLALLGAAALTFGAWLAASEVGPLAGRRADGDLELGLTALGVAVCLPSLVTAWLAMRRGEGGPVFAEVCAAGALGLAGGLGAAALVIPLTISETFMGWPAAGVCLAAAAMVALASARPRPLRGLRAAGGVVYAGLLAAFARSAG